MWFQPGSLAATVAPTLVPYAVAPPPGYRAVGPGWLASPEGLQFDRAVTLTLPLDSSLISPGERLLLFTASRDGTSPEFLDGVPVGETLVTFIWHFSVFLPVTPIRPDAGVVDAGQADSGTSGVDAGPPVVPFDGGCRASPDWAAVRCEGPTATDGGTCQLSSACGGGVRSVQCEHGRCECRIGEEISSTTTGYSGSCFGAWNCVCGFPSLCPARASEPAPGAQPGVNEYPIGTRCFDHYDCREDVCWNSTGGWACAALCRSGPEPRCPCGKTCLDENAVSICVPQ